MADNLFTVESGSRHVTRGTQAKFRPAQCLLLAQSGGPCGKTSLEPASFQTPPVALNIFGAFFRKAELSLLKFPADKDEALLFSLAECFQARSFRG